MEDRYTQKVDMIGTVNGTLANPAYTTALATVPVIPARIGTYTGKTTTLAGLLAKLGLSTKGITIDKAGTTQQLITGIIALAKAGATYAYERGNAALEKQLDLEKTDLVELHDALIDDQAEAIRAALQTIVTADAGKALDATPEPIQAYGVTQPKLDAINALIIAYAAIVNAPRNAEISQSMALAAAEQQVDDIMEYLTKVLDRLLVQLKGDPSGVYEAYTSARKIINRPGKGSGDGEKPAENPSTK
jgi:hypothetical protein